MDRDLAQSIGTAARTARLALQLTQEDAAERIGVSVEFYSRIERGTALPSLTTLVRITVVLNVSADVLIGLKKVKDEGEHVAVPPAMLPSREEEAPEIRRILRRLRKASPGTRRLVNTLLKEIERIRAEEGEFEE